MNIAILGEGAWGTACATLFANNGHTVRLWCYNSEIAEQIKQTRFNQKYLPNIELDDKIMPTDNIREAIEQADLICEAIPVQFLRYVINQCREFIIKEQVWVILSKGIEGDTLFLPSQILKDILGKDVDFVVLSGPSFAIDLAQKQITAVNFASNKINLSQKLQKLLDNNYFKSFIIDDSVGIQVCGAVKNCYAIALGMLTQLNYGDNAKAFLITRALEEILQLCVAMGGQPNTVYNLAGVGDLVLTSLSGKSRNFQFGQQIAKGKKLSDLQNYFTSMPEGLNTLKSIYYLQKKNNLNIKLIDNIYKIIFLQEPIENIFYKLI